jgi:Uma2 family endonuclease
MAEAAVQPKPMTFEEAAALDPDDYAGEVVNGEWIPVTRGTWRHGEVVVRACLILALYAREHREWSVATADPGTKLSRDPDTLRGPDIGVVRADRRPQGKGEAGWLEGAPDLVVEVVGDSQTATQLAKKAMEYVRAGTQAVWILDADPRLVMVITADRQLTILGEDDTLDGGDVLPGFSCKVSEFFE